jgi:tRNA(Ile2) C34 agmatinyltransferase TiaS
MCGGEGSFLGALGRTKHFRCRDCGMDFSKTPKRRKRRVDDDQLREMAMEAGMAFGCDGYNDVYGY